MKTLLTIATLLTTSAAFANTFDSREIFRQIRVEKAKAATQIDTLLWNTGHPFLDNWERHAVAYIGIQESLNSIASRLKMLESNASRLSESEKAAMEQIVASVAPVSADVRSLIGQLNDDQRVVLRQAYRKQLQALARKALDSSEKVRNHVIMALNASPSSTSGGM